MKKFLSILKSCFIIFTAIIVTTPAYAALPGDDVLDMYNKNGIYYYNPEGNADNCNNSSTMLSGSDTAEKIWNFFIQQGFTDAQAAGLLGNGMVESGLVATRASNSSFWGLFQWGGGRKDRLFKKLSDAGLSKYTSTEYWGSDAEKKIPANDYDKILQIELEHTMEEKDLNWQEEIKKANTPELAAEIFLVLFERAVNGESEVIYYAPYAGLLYQGTKARRNFAKEFYDKYAGKGIQSTGGVNGNAENGKNVTIIGDSITVGSKSALMEKFPDISESDINGRVSRPWSEGVTIAKNMNLKDIVVYALGSNSPGLTKSQVEDIIVLIGADKTIVFVTNYDGKHKDRYTSNNNIFKELAKSNSNIIVADWAQTVDQNPETYLYNDMLHPNAAGANLFAETIWKAINSNTNENGCSVNGEFQALVLGYAWPDYHPAPWHDRMPAYAEAVTQSISEGRYVGGSVAGVPGIDCGGFVTILVQNSGLEPNYNDSRGATDTQEAWVKSHNWDLINSSAGTKVDTSLLQPGDVAFSDGHTFIYVGEIPGFNSVIASASYSTRGAGRAPMAGKEDLTFGNGAIVRWYRNPNFHPAETPAFSRDVSGGKVTNDAPAGATLLKDHHITFYGASASENGGYAGRNASSKYNNGNLAPGQAASSYLPLGTVVYVKTQPSGEASYANGKYFLITDRGAGKIHGDYNLDIFHDVAKPSDNNYPPYGSSSTAKIYKVAEGVSWSTFKAKYGW
ncbi:MAG: hypothetical protein K6F57_02605 [Candidatus Saccharibacteria bacterium]|nr:hypothetical protein [Candidatus Saccharibacteria bacterium]